MTRPRWKISDIMLLIVVAGIVLAGFRTFWEPGGTNYWLILGTYLAVLTTATLAACDPRARSRKAWVGYAFFGWVYFVCVLHAGFVGVTFDSEYLSRNAVMGIGFGVLCGIAASRLPGPFPGFGRPPADEDIPAGGS
jgi:hypothetical protein